ncbi:MAG: inositol 2-dehydrogenase, partial [Spirochaetaceae bacterium]|nr:inositol 2-dehydrogenase [Spirochaetaceae bacterium]
VRSEKPLFFFLERYAESFAEELRDFVKAVNDGVEVPGRKAALNSVLIALAAKKSLETGLPVEVDRE